LKELNSTIEVPPGYARYVEPPTFTTSQNLIEKTASPLLPEEGMIAPPPSKETPLNSIFAVAFDPLLLMNAFGLPIKRT
jgi:hypothetical protein